MISPELLRRYPFFGAWDDAFLKQAAMLGEEIERRPGQVVYESGSQADALYLLLEGCVETYLVIADPDTPGAKKEFYLGDINAGEVFGFYALVAPFFHTTTMRVSSHARLVSFDAPGLRSLVQDDERAGRIMAQQVAAAALERLQSTRIQLAASRTF